jgi:hypothetical protein
MKVLAEPEVAEFVRDRGGRLFVWPDAKACCGGAITFLLTDAEPAPGRRFGRVDAPGFELWFDPGAFAPPEELHLEVRGRRRRRVEAYWNGCVFAV